MYVLITFPDNVHWRSRPPSRSCDWSTFNRLLLLSFRRYMPSAVQIEKNRAPTFSPTRCRWQESQQWGEVRVCDADVSTISVVSESARPTLFIALCEGTGPYTLFVLKTAHQIVPQTPVNARGSAPDVLLEVNRKLVWHSLSWYKIPPVNYTSDKKYSERWSRLPCEVCYCETWRIWWKWTS